jgi:AcrR family transcriptional regulator
MDIAHRAGLSHVTIYNHFSSKEELMKEVFRREMVGIIEESKAIIRDKTVSLPDKLKQIALHKSSRIQQFQGQLMKRIGLESPDMQRFLQKLWQEEMDRLIGDLLALGKQEGYIDRELSDDAVRLYFEILRRGGMASGDILSDMAMNEKLIMDLTRLMLYGLLRSEAGAAAPKKTEPDVTGSV